MPEQSTSREGSVSGAPEQGAPPIAYDDVMQRLLEYQRHLREGLSPREAAQAVAEAVASAGGSPSEPEPAVEPVVTATEHELLVDLTEAEAELEARTVQEAVMAEAGEKGEVVTGEAEAEGGAPAEEVAVEAGASVWATPEPTPDAELTARVEQLERTLAAVSQQVGELRQRFQDMAIAADERLAELERTLSRARAR